MLYICIFSNKFDLKQTIRVLHNRHKINNGKIICAILDFVKTLKDPHMNSSSLSKKSKKMKNTITNKLRYLYTSMNSLTLSN